MQRFEIINLLITKYKLKNYLEIGVYRGQNIREIIAEHKDGVDPGSEGQMVPEVNYPVTSDEFFSFIRDYPEIMYDIIFIDGMHEHKQVYKDFTNAYRHLKPNGIIVLHDCNPLEYEYTTIPRQTGIWHGDVYKAVMDIRTNYPNNCFYTVDSDCGCGIFYKGEIETDRPNKEDLQKAKNDWNFFNENRKNLLSLISDQEFKNKILSL